MQSLVVQPGQVEVDVKERFWVNSIPIALWPHCDADLVRMHQRTKLALELRDRCAEIGQKHRDAVSRAKIAISKWNPAVMRKFYETADVEVKAEEEEEVDVGAAAKSTGEEDASEKPEDDKSAGGARGSGAKSVKMLDGAVEEDASA
ncbi:unnamed protein product, partial [Amoebophrya sp. A25]|eukprot:GSA25T00025045001.1